MLGGGGGGGARGELESMADPFCPILVLRLMATEKIREMACLRVCLRV